MFFLFFPFFSESQSLLVHAAAVHLAAEPQVLVAHVGAAGQRLPRGPDLLLGPQLALVVRLHALAHELLEVEGPLLHLGVQLAVDEDAGVDVLLGGGAEVLVLGHDALVDGVDELEVLVGGVLVAVDLVAHDGLAGAGGVPSCRRAASNSRV